MYESTRIFIPAADIDCFSGYLPFHVIQQELLRLFTVGFMQFIKAICSTGECNQGETIGQATGNL